MAIDNFIKSERNTLQKQFPRHSISDI